LHKIHDILLFNFSAYFPILQKEQVELPCVEEKLPDPHSIHVELSIAPKVEE
jgi:hypothetical protein